VKDCPIAREAVRNAGLPEKIETQSRKDAKKFYDPSLFLCVFGALRFIIFANDLNIRGETSTYPNFSHYPE